MKPLLGFLIFLFLFFFLLNVSARNTKRNSEKVYKINYKWEIPFTGCMFALNIGGFYMLEQKPTLTPDKVNSLDQDDVWSFDRGVFSQSHPAPSGIYDMANIGLWTAYAAPALLFIDDDIRKDWLDITLLYLETQAINLNIYVWGGPVFTKRIRPLVYIEDQSMDYKLGKETTDSFFSGHVSMVAGASFFMAKVISDYHPQLENKKWLLYGAAIVPPAIMGYMRYRGFMHFPTDLLLGGAVGAGVGVLVPQLHKITSKTDKDLSIVPFTGRYTGVACSLKF
jgi:membrane-associated phospholipid phosphatase